MPDVKVVSPQPNVLSVMQPDGLTLEFWLLVAVTGTVSGLAAGLLLRLLHLVQHLVWHYRAATFFEAIGRSPWWARILVLVSAGLLVAVLAPRLGRARPDRPSELEASIWFDDGRLPPFETLAKAVLSIVLVGFGASLGREAAPKQVGTLVGGLLAQWRGMNATKRRLLAACGAGAGIASIYDVPFGAAVFLLEVLLGTLSLPLIAPAFLATMTGTVAGWLVIPDKPTFHLPAMALSPGLVAWAVVVAPFLGVASALFVKLIARAVTLKPESALARSATTMGVFTTLGLASIALPQLLGNGEGIVELAGLDRLALPTLLFLVVLKPLATAGCLGTGAPGGLFMPVITFGAALGAALGAIWLHVWPDAAPGAFALVGAAAVLAATTKGPISALVLMMELTHGMNALAAASLVAIAGATFVAHRIDPRSIYTSRLGSASSFELGWEKGRVSTATRYGDLTHLMLSVEGAVTVVDEGGEALGELTRDDVETHGARLRPLEIATASDVLEVKNGAR